MTDTKKLPASRIDIALQYLKASETNDKAAYERLLSDTYHSTTWPTENPDDVTSTKEKVLVAYAWYDKYREIQAIPIDVMETTDGRIILHVSHLSTLQAVSNSVLRLSHGTRDFGTTASGCNSN